MAKTDIEIYVPQLPDTPGWIAFSPTEKEWLQEHTSRALTHFRGSGLEAIKCCIELASIKTFLNGKSMTWTNWVRSSFGSSERTAYRWLESFEQMRGPVGDDNLLYLAEEGLAGVNNTLQPRELVPVLKALPAPKSPDKKAREAWRLKVSEELRTRRTKRRKRIPLTLGDEDALRAFVLTARRLLREAKLDSSAEQRKWLARGVGYVMQLRAISGTITAERTPIPEGFMPKLGRPRTRPTGKAA